MTQELTLTKLESITELNSRIILYNDDVNSFEWVIQSLVEVCEHSTEQAEQCATIVHYKGKYAVKSGSFKDLSPRCEQLMERGLTVEVV